RPHRDRKRPAAAGAERTASDQLRINLPENDRPPGRWGRIVQPFVALLLLLAISPLTILILHAVLYRLGAALNVRLTGHASAMFAMIAGLAIVLAGSWGLVFRTWIGMPFEIALGVIYVGSVYGALALLYLVAINIAETSLHMHTLLEIAWAT